MAAALTTGCGAGSIPVPDIPPAPPVFQYAPVDARYTAAYHRAFEQDFVTGSSTIVTDLRIALTTEWAPPDSLTSDRAVRFTVDTVLYLDVPGAGDDDRQAARTTPFRARLTPTGELVEFEPEVASRQLVQLISNRLQQFLPGIPAGGVSPGTAWRDTVTATTTSGGVEMTTTAFVTNRAGGWEQREGRGIMTVTWSAEYSMAGRGTQFGAAFEITGSGVTTGEHLLSAEGQYLGTISRDSAVAEISLPTAGITVPVRQSGADTVWVIR